MKRKICMVLCALLLSSALLTGCGRTPAVDTATDTESDTETVVGMPETESDTTGDNGQNEQNGGMTDGQNNNQTTGNDQDSMEQSPVETVQSAEDAVRFISHNLYSLCSDVLPMAVETRALDLSDADTVQYNTGLTATDGITDIVLSESAVGSVAYSLVYVRTDGTDTDAIHQSLTDSIDPRKWVCVEAEAMNTIRLDNDIMLIMGSAEQVETISTSVKEAANGVFENVGDIYTVL